MATSAPAIVTSLTGRAWIRNSDGTRTELHEGSKIPAGADIVTDAGASVALQVENGLPLVIGAGREVAMGPEVGAPALPDASEAAVTPPQGTDSDRLLAALQAGQDPFENLDPTAAVVGGGGDNGGSSFVRLARILETTTPLDLSYPNPSAAADTLNRVTGLSDGTDDGTGAATPAATNNAPLAVNDAASGTERQVVTGNLLANDSDPDGDPLTLVSVNGRPMTSGGIDVPGANGGTFTVLPDGSFTFNPGTEFVHLGAGQTTTTTISYTVTDPSGATSTATVTVTIVGVNDTAIITPANPGDDAGVVQEDVKLEVSGKLNVTDPDDGEAVFRAQTGTAGQHGTFTLGTDGNWTYTLNNADPRVQALGVGESLTETFTVVTADGTTATVTVTIDGTNDIPTLSGVDSGSVSDGGETVATGKLDVADIDTNDAHSWSVSNEGKGSYGAFSVDANGNWTYNLDSSNGDVKALLNGQTLTETFTVTVDDGHGGTATQTVTIVINGTDDGAVITPSKPGDDAGTVKEDEVLSTSGKLDVTDPDAGQAVFVPQTNAAGSHGTFSIDANGNWTYNLTNADPAVQALAVGEKLTETFTVVTADGTTGTVTVTIEGTNDAPVIAGQASGAVTDGGTTTASGQLTQTDVDTSDKHTWSVNDNGQGKYGSLTLDQTGKWVYTLDQNNADVKALTTGQNVTETFTVTVDDGHGGTDTQVVTIVVNGTDDGAVITPSKPGDDAGTVKEDEVLSTSGKLDVTDPDAGQAVFVPQTGEAGKHGTFSIDANGNWTYTLTNTDKAVQALAVGEHLTETFTVVTADGTTGTVTVTIEGTNDAPVIAGQASGAVTDGGTTTASGQLTQTDVDTSDKHTWSVNDNGQGKYGSLTLDQTGKWVYTLDQNNADVKALTTGQNVTETFTVTVDDGHGGTDIQVVTIVVNGTDDGAIITPSKPGDDAGTVKEDEVLSTSGKLDVTDPDAGQAVFVPQTGEAGKHGSFSIDANGNWTYTLTNTDKAVQALAVGEHLTETFTVVTADGTTGTVTVTIEGTNDKPVIAGQASGSVTDGGETTASGQLTQTDVDTSDSHTWSVADNGQGKYGSLTLDQTGKWVYTLDQNNADVKALVTGQHVTETFTVTVDDGNGGTDTKTITVTINGTDDGAIITPSKPGDDAGTVKEDEIYSTGGKLDVTDPDAGQAVFVAQNNEAGKHGTFSIDANGNWTYTLTNTDKAVQALAVGEHLTETFTVVTADGTTGTVTVTIEGTNDKPVISGQAAGAVTDGGESTASGQLTQTDVDTSDKHTWSVNDNGQGKYGTFSVDQTGKWTFQLDPNNADVKALVTGQHVTETFTVTVDDGNGGTDTKTITVTINGTDDGAIITPSKPGDDAGTVKEDEVLSTSGKLDVTDPDAGQAVFVPQTGEAGKHGSFSIDANGNWTYTLTNTDKAVQALAVGEHLTETFTVVTADGTTGTVTVTIEGTNDDPKLAGELTGSVTEDGEKSAHGQLTVTDVDTSDTHTYQVVGKDTGTYGSFSVDGNGKWTYTLDNDAAQALKEGEVKTETYTVEVSDGNGGTDTKVVTITITGTNDTAIITPSKPGDDAGTVKEDEIYSTGGKLDVKDADAGESVFKPQTDAPGKHGTFSIDANGNWTYTLTNTDKAVQALAVGEHLTETFTVVTADGTTGTVTVTIEGTNDKPVIAGQASGSVTDGGTTTASGQLTQTDVDTSDKHTWSVNDNGQGKYGTFSVDNDGKWTFKLDPNNTEVKALVTGQHVTETFTVTVDDGNGGTDTKTITVTINGTDDGAIITPSKPGDDAGTVKEDEIYSTGGKLDVTDPDAGQAVFVAQTGEAGKHGTFSIDANGNWTYTLTNTDKAVQALAVGEHLTETFTVVTADGTTGTVTVTIEGTNDKPVISGQAAGAVTDGGETTASGQLTQTDVDTSDKHTWSVNDNGQGKYGTFSVDQTGKWTFQLDTNNTDVKALVTGQHVTETFTVTVDDGNGGTDTKTITVTINGTDDGAIITPSKPGDDAGTVKEDEIYSTGGKLDVTDPDAGQAVFVAQNNEAGKHGSFSIDANGNWTYTLTNTDKAVQALAVGEHLTETFTVVTADGTTGTVTVTIEGTNDDPKLAGELTGSVTEDGEKSAHGQLTVTDVDTSDTHTYQVVGKDTGTYGSFSVDGNGKWTYTLDNDAAQALKEGEVKTETYTVEVSDGNGGTDTKVVTITITGTNDTAIITPSKPGDDAGTVKEDEIYSTGGKLDVKDADAGESVFKPQTDAPGKHGTFSIDANGNWTYTLTNTDKAVQALAVGEHLTETFTVVTADGTTGTVTVTIEGTNDKPVISGQAAGAVTDGGETTASGQLTQTDVDTSDSHTWSVADNGQGKYGTFSVDQTGKWTFQLDPNNTEVKALVTGQHVTETFTVTVDDGNGGTDTKTITVTINGTDDGAIITPSKPGDDAGTVKEDEIYSTGGKLDVTDPDAGQAVFVAQNNEAGKHGTFSIDANGNWTYTLTNTDKAVQALAVGEHLTETFTVVTADGTTGTVTVTIEGTNDKPVISGQAAGAVTDGGETTASGQLTQTDVDTSDKHTWSVNDNGQGKYGTFSVDQTGKWTFQLDTNNTDVKALVTGQHVTETFTVTVDDGNGGTDTKTITVTINGTDDGAIITPSKPGDDAGTVKEDEIYSTGGKLDVTDPDAGQAVFVAQNNEAGKHGTFSIDANGNWTYTLTNTDKAVQALAVGEHLTETFTVVTADGTTGTVTVTIEGTNDDPKLAGELTGSVTEDGEKSAHGQLTVTDVDTSDTHTYQVVGKDTGTYGSFSVDSNGKWTYTLDNDAAQALKEGEVKTETYTVEVSDGNGGTDTKVVTITITGTNDTAIITPSKPGDDAGTVKEDEIYSTGGKLDVKDADAGESVFKPQTDAPGKHGTFSIDANGNWTYTLTNTDKAVQALAVGEHLTETFTVVTADGTTGTVTVTIEGTNDKPVISGQAAGAVTDGGETTASGQLTQTDVDTSDKHTWSVNDNGQGKYGTFSVDQTGKWTFKLDPNNADVKALVTGQHVTETFTVTVDDGNGGTDTKTITVTINGTDDGAIITPSKPGDDAGTVKEDEVLSTSGKLDVTDPDAGQAVFVPQTGEAGKHGSFSIDANGNWTYTLTNTDKAVQALAVGEHLTETFTVVTADGTTGTVTVTIEGTNDDPKLAGELTGSVTEDGEKSAHGQLTVTDVDTSDTHTYQVVGKDTGTYGSFSVDGNGKWTYTLDNDAAQALKEGEVKTETYTVEVSDGNGGTDTKVVTITITGTNDTAIITPSKPGDDAGTVKEDEIYSTGGKLDVKDADAGESVFKPQTDAPGKHGTFSIDANGNWTYTLTNTDKAVQALAVGEHLTETFTVVTADGTTGTVTVTIEGTNDKPVIAGQASGSVTDGGTTTASGQLTQTDVDTSDKHTWSVNDNGQGKYGTFSVDNDGKWTFKLDPNNTDVKALVTGQHVTETFTVTVDDGNGGTDTKTITVTINGTDDGAVITPSKPGDDAGTVKEDEIYSTGGKLDVTDPDAGQAVFVAQNNEAGKHGTFSIDANGNWTYTLTNTDKAVQALAVGEHLTETFTVVTADGTTGTVTVTIEGTNDDPKLAGELTGSVTEDGEKSAHGQLTVTDVDTSDTHTYQVVGKDTGTYGSFSVDGNGKWTYTLDNDAAQALKEGEVKTETYTVEVSDGNGGTDTKVVTITITGTNDTAIITPSKPGDDAGTVKEDEIYSTGGKLDVKDADAGEAVFKPQTDEPGKHGTFSIDANGNWTYTLTNTDKAVQALAVGEHLTETFTVVTADGTTGTVTVTIEGTNDKPVIAGQASGSVTDGGTTTASGQLTQTDVDTSDKHTWSVNDNGQGKYGTFSVDNDGKWTFKLDPNNTDVKALVTGQHVTETFTVTVDDGNGGTDTKTITVTINGTDDGAIITPSKPGDDAGTVKEDEVLSTGGKLDVTDPDAGQAVFVAQTGEAGKHGTFSIDANGNWTYTLTNTDKAVQALAVGEHLTETFTVVTADGTKGTVTVTIEGTNDNPKLAGQLTGTVTEDGKQSAQGQLTVTDVDTSDTHTYKVLGKDTGTYGSFSVDGSGKWTYTLNNDAAQALKEGESKIETYTVEVSDGHGGTDSKVVTITINGTNDIPVVTGDDKGTVKEDEILSVNGKLNIVDADAGESSFVAGTTAGKYGNLVLDSTGKWTYTLTNTLPAVQALGANDKLTDVITVKTADGTSQTVTITINGTNDKPVIAGVTTGAVTEDGTQTATGQLTKTDVDTTDTHTWSIISNPKGTYGTLTLDNTGKWTYTIDNAKAQELKGGQTVTETYTVQVDDNHGGTDTKVVTITINGTNDIPVITGDDKGTVKEDEILSVNGKLNIVDADAGESSFVAGTKAGTYGNLVLAADGKWTYTLTNTLPAVQALGANDKLTDVITVKTADGTSQTVTITINGTNDKPVIAGVTTGAVTEDGTQTATGQLTKTDVDTTDTHTWSIISNRKGTYGTLTLDNTGKWTYTIDNAKAQELKGGQTVTETYTVQVDDNHGGTDTKVVTITINGTNDIPVITGNDKGTVQEDITLQINGKLNVVDADAGESSFVAQTTKTTPYGTFTIDSNGNWTYALNNTLTAVQALGAKDTLTDVITVKTADGTDKTVTITIKGNNDAPVISGVTTGAVEEDGKQTATGQLTKTDVDTTDTHTWSITSNPKGTYGTLTLDNTGKWTYTIDNAKAQELKGGQVVTETFTVKVDDGNGGTDTKTVTINVTGKDDLPTITGDTSGQVVEDYKLTATGTLNVVDKDLGESGVKGTTLTGLYGTLVIGNDGKWTYTLNNSLPAVQNLAQGAVLTDNFTVTAGDGKTTQPISVSVVGTNDAPVAADNSSNVDVGHSHTFTLGEFNFSDGAEGNNLQSVIISRLPTDGTLTLNGNTVSAGTSVSAADIASGKLVFTPSSAGKDTSFGFKVVDDGGTDHGGQNTSKEYNFALNTNNIVIGDNSGTTITGGSGDDVILGDRGGMITTVEPGKNYNIALVIDTSGSMSDGINGNNTASRISLVRDALTNLAKQLAGHDGIVNVTLIGFATGSNSLITLQNLTSANLKQLTDKIATLSASGGTNYEAAFNTAVAWFNSQAAAGKTAANGYENVTFFLTDGDPTYYVKSDNSTGGTGNSTDYTTLKESVDAFQPLANSSKVYGIGIGNGVNTDYLRLFDNTGSGGTAYVTFGSGSSSTLANFNSSSGWGNMSNWDTAGTSQGSVTRSSSALMITDQYNSGTAVSTSAGSPQFAISSGKFAQVKFYVETSNFSSGDKFTWTLQVWNASKNAWDTVESGSRTTSTSGITLNTGVWASGTYRMVYEVTDTTNNSRTATVYVDDIALVTYDASQVVAAPAGSVDIVLKGSDLEAALQGGSTEITPAVVGNDTIHGGDGNDIIFGDTINTDKLSWTGNAAGTHDGQGLKALQDMLLAQNGHAATSEEIYNYIKDNHAQFNVDGDTRGGDDTVYGGAGNDIIYGQGGNDKLYGGEGNDIIYGGTGDDLIVGGKGNDTLIGGDGQDTFKWELNDQGSTAAPAVDTIKDFSTQAASQGGDILDLKDLLQGETDATLTQFLKIEKDGNNTVININTQGHIGQGADQKIVLEGVDLTNNGQHDTQAIINDLLQKGKLNVDHS